MRTQGTELFLIDPDTDDVIEVGCATSINGLDTSKDSLETTCLQDLTRTYESGLATPATATFTINTDPQDASHVRLHQLKVAGTTVKWALGWSDGTAPPTELGGNFVLTDERSWLTFEGFMNSYSFEFALNSSVNSSVGIQVSGEPVLVPKSATA